MHKWNVTYLYDRLSFSNEDLLYDTKWMNLENILRSQSERLCVVWFHLQEMSWISNFIETQNNGYVELEGDQGE